jgi:hypothetical protein
VRTLVSEVRAAGFGSLRIERSPGSPEDIVDVCKLTCLEQSMPIAQAGELAPVLRVMGHKVNLELPQVEKVPQ